MGPTFGEPRHSPPPRSTQLTSRADRWARRTRLSPIRAHPTSSSGRPSARCVSIAAMDTSRASSPTRSTRASPSSCKRPLGAQNGRAFVTTAGGQMKSGVRRSCIFESGDGLTTTSIPLRQVPRPAMPSKLLPIDWRCPSWPPSAPEQSNSWRRCVRSPNGSWRRARCRSGTTWACPGQVSSAHAGVRRSGQRRISSPRTGLIRRALRASKPRPQPVHGDTPESIG